MLSHHVRREVEATYRPDFCDVTDQLQAEVEASGITHGRLTVFTPDETCSILINERESGLLEDLRRVAERVDGGAGFPLGLGSASAVLPIVGGRLHLGTWQRVFHVALDGNGSKHELVVQIVGEKD